MKGSSSISKRVWWIQSGFNFNFRFEFEYRIHRTIKGTHLDAFLVVKMLHMRCNSWEKTPSKISHSTSFCAGSDDPALGRMIRPNSAQTFGVSPDDPALGWMIRTWWLVSVQNSPGRMIRPYTEWSEPGNFSVCFAYYVPTPDDLR